MQAFISLIYGLNIIFFGNGFSSSFDFLSGVQQEQNLAYYIYFCYFHVLIHSLSIGLLNRTSCKHTQHIIQFESSTISNLTWAFALLRNVCTYVRTQDVSIKKKCAYILSTNIRTDTPADRAHEKSKAIKVTEAAE